MEYFFWSPISVLGLLVTKIPLRLYLLREFPLAYVFRPKTGFGAEAASLDSDLIVRLLDIVVASDCIPSSLKNRVVGEIEALSVSSRPVYGLISLAHSLRLISRIRGSSSGRS